MENTQGTQVAQGTQTGAPAQYTTQSRGYKTKGNEYKDRYVEIKCPESGCLGERAYKDTWKTRIKYTCLKRNCRRVWYEAISKED